jgi:hypothetical protein
LDFQSPSTSREVVSGRFDSGSSPPMKRFLSVLLASDERGKVRKRGDCFVECEKERMISQIKSGHKWTEKNTYFTYHRCFIFVLFHFY